jgi:hypothetical protein
MTKLKAKRASHRRACSKPVQQFFPPTEEGCKIIKIIIAGFYG